MNTVDQHEFNIVLNHVYGDAVTASRIIAGALWLDEVDGPWWEHVNLDTFDINDASRCVLGQVVAGECTQTDWDSYTTRAPFYRAVYKDQAAYIENRTYLGEQGVKYAIPFPVAKALGFHLFDGESDDWSVKMNRGWYALIALRQDRQETLHPYYRHDEDLDDAEQELEVEAG